MLLELTDDIDHFVILFRRTDGDAQAAFAERYLTAVPDYDAGLREMIIQLIGTIHFHQQEITV